MPEHKRKLNY